MRQPGIVIAALFLMAAPAAGSVAGAAVTPAQAAPSQAAAVDPVEIREALERREFEVLEERLLAARERWKADHASPERERLVEAFRELSPPQAKALYAWSHERPSSAPARLALAAHYIGEAWRARGTRFARDTSSDRLAKMRDYCVRAAGAAEEALALDPDWVDAHRLRMEAARLTSDRATHARALAAALALAPDDYAVRWEHARGLTPRWGGSYQALDAFVAESQAYAATNPRLELLLGRSDADRGEVLSADEQYEEAVALLSRALRHGEEPAALSDRGWTLHRLERHGEARADLERAVALEPGRAKHHSRLASALVQLREFDRAILEWKEAERLDPDEPYYRKRRLELQSWMVARKQHDRMEREKPVSYAAFRASHALLVHSAAVAGGSVALWLGWQVWRRRRAAPGGGAAPEAARATASGIGRLLLQSYAWLVALFHAYVYLWGALRGSRTEPEDHVDLALTALALLGVLAFAHGRRVVVADLWRGMAFAFPAWNLVYHFHLEGGDLQMVGTWLPIHAFLLPAYVSLFRYGFRSESLWKR